MSLKTRTLLLLLALSTLTGCAQKKNAKINGISFVASRMEVVKEHVDPVLELNANYAAIMPFGFLRDAATPDIVHNTSRQWFGETRNGCKQYIEMLHANKIKVMVKPQIWIRHGEFTGYMKMESEDNWKKLESSYRDFILEYATLAAEMNVELFCIGTELEQFIVNRPDYWKRLISEIKSVFKGKLTYAANWDEYKRVPFWKDLDYVGVDAYFPIDESKTPSLEESKKGWQKWKVELQEVSEREKKQILFVEYGYRSVDFSGKEPWVSDHTLTDVNLEAQTNLTKALFEELYPQDWFAGGFIWKWFLNHKEVGGVNDPMFTPQNKPVEKVIQQQFKITN